MIQVGDVVCGEITGIRPYGAFVALDDGYKGLIHISEISKDYVKDVRLFVHMHERVAVKVLEVEDKNHVKLSLKAVSPHKARYHAHRHHQEPALPKAIIGFSSLNDHLKEWIDAAYEKQQEDKL